MFAFNLFGPALKYRLDVFDHCSGKTSDYVMILTDKESYKFYKDYHHKYKFVFVEDVENRSEISINHEILPNVFKDESDQIKNLKGFYESKDAAFPFEIQRYIMYYMMKENINNYCIVDCDTILVNDKDRVKRFFDSIPVRSVYAPHYGWETSGIHQKNHFWNKVRERAGLDIDLQINADFLNPDGTVNRDVVNPDEYAWDHKLFLQNRVGSFNDGYMRGFHFESKEHQDLFYKIWNAATDHLLEQRCIVAPEKRDGMQLLDMSERRQFWSPEFVTSNLMYFFTKLFNYKFEMRICGAGDAYVYDANMENPYGYTPNLVCRHRPRPEDNLYSGNLNGRGAWHKRTFNYDKTGSFVEFIQNNREELDTYYKEYPPFITEVTDTHVFNKLSE